MRDHVLLYLNGRERRVRGGDVFLPLSTWLRDVERAVGTKVVCEEGDCGACTVLVGRVREGRLHYLPVNSCIQLVGQLDCTHVVTVEAVADGAKLSSVQEKMVDHHGAQCGYCTPGFIMALTGLAEERKDFDEHDVRQALTGNLCRCTGYLSIVEAAMQARGEDHRRIEERFPSTTMVPSLDGERRNSLGVEFDGRAFFAPATLREALEIKAGRQNVVVVQGGTDVGVLANKRGFTPPTLLNLAHVEELGAFEGSDDALSIGANVTLARLEKEVEGKIPELHRILTLFGSPQIRNAGTVAGNIANGSPIADLLPFLFVYGATVVAQSVRGERKIAIDSFYKGYKTLDLAADELITRVIIPLPPEGETLRLYKVSKRRDLDISTFSAAVRMRLSAGTISGARVAFGGVAPTCIRLPKTESLLENRELSEETFRRAGEQARDEIAPISDVRGSKEFRLQLAENVMMKFFYEVSEGR